jgi:phosphoglycolate phosphatase-like HAD superfamily hydrolase
MKGIIFDLDLTLVDSTIAENARSHRDWTLVYSLIPRFVLYPGIEEVFQFIRSNRQRYLVSIVSTAPSSYVSRVANHFHIPVDTIIGYHDAPRKPSPAGMLLAMQRMGTLPEDTVSFGDRAIDIQASKAAGIRSIACTWGTKEEYLLKRSYPDSLISSSLEMINYL